MKTFVCTQCQKEKEGKQDGGTGYGVYRDGSKICYQCIGENDLKELQIASKGQKFTFYLVKRDGQYFVTNWPGTFSHPVTVSIGRHNMAGKRYDTWFKIGQNSFHGVTFGDWTQIHHVKRIKG